MNYGLKIKWYKHLFVLFVKRQAPTTLKVKRFRSDIGRWEEIRTINIRGCSIPFWYRYTIWGVSPKSRMFKIKGAEYVDLVPLVRSLGITQEEFQQNYEGNKWLLPINRHVK